MAIDYRIREFTDHNFRRLVRLAKSRYNFISYDQYGEPGRNILWRHDLDFSVHRAATLAAVEAEEGVRGTYFLWLHSPAYNLLETAITAKVFRILELGHHIGLHFDPAFYSAAAASSRPLEEALTLEKKLLENIFGREIKVFSWHNPAAAGLLEARQTHLAGMINAYADDLSADYRYCSDSYGFWRFTPLEELLAEGGPDRLQVLTHPENWAPEPLTPRQRIQRCFDGRAARQAEDYDLFLKQHPPLKGPGQ